MGRGCRYDGEGELFFRGAAAPWKKKSDPPPIPLLSFFFSLHHSQILHYENGAKYEPHHDFFHGERDKRRERAAPALSLVNPLFTA